MLLLIGLLVSFLGQLPLGYINVMAVKIAVDKSPKKAIHFAGGIAIVEVLYVALIMYGLSSFLSHSLYIKWVQLGTSIAFIIAAIFILIKWNKQPKTNETNIQKPNPNSFLYGLFISATNVAQFPFWIIWISYFINLKWLTNTNIGNNLFILGTGFGTLLGMLVYIFAGKFLLEKFKKPSHYLELIIALLFLVTALFQLQQFLL